MNGISFSLRCRRGATILVLFAMIGVFSNRCARATDLFWNTDGASHDWLDPNWSTSASGPFDMSFSSGDAAHFTVNSSLTSLFNVDFSGVTVDPSTVVILTGNSGSQLGTGGTVATIDVGADGALDLCNTTSEPIANDPGTGFIKNGDGILLMAGTPLVGSIPYDGGFTLNAGTVILRTNNTLGIGPLTINGGAIMATAGTRTVSSSSVTVGGDFTYGGVTSAAISSNGQGNRSITITGDIDLTGDNRTITIGAGATATYTLSGAISNGTLTVAAADSTATGTLALSGANTYVGDTTLNSGKLSPRSSTDTADPNTYTSGPFGKGTLVLNGGTLIPDNPSGGRTIANPISVMGSTVMLGTSSGSTAPIYTGPITGSGTLDTSQSSGSSNLNYAGDISGFTGTFGISGGTSVNRVVLKGSTAESLDGSQAKFVNNGTGANDQWRIGVNFAYSNPTLKMGSLSGSNTGHAINPNSDIGNITLEIGHLGLDDDFEGAVSYLGGSKLNIRKVVPVRSHLERQFLQAASMDRSLPARWTSWMAVSSRATRPA